jgi:uncharacterized protein YbcV (DUF1398 family)
MDTNAILAAAHATHAGTLPFPDVVGLLVGAGVEYYHVDYVGRRTTFSDAAGAAVVVPLPYEDLPPVAPELDLDGLQASIRDSQQHGQPHRAFSRRAMAAGVQGYLAFLAGRRVIYLGRLGEQHTEWFPQR